MHGSSEPEPRTISDDFDAQVAGIAALASRCVGRCTAASLPRPTPVSRDEAASGVGVPGTWRSSTSTSSTTTGCWRRVPPAAGAGVGPVPGGRPSSTGAPPGSSGDAT